MRALKAQAWFTAAYQRHRRLPDLRSILRRTVEQPTPEEMKQRRAEHHDMVKRLEHKLANASQPKERRSGRQSRNNR